MFPRLIYLIIMVCLSYTRVVGSAPGNLDIDAQLCNDSSVSEMLLVNDYDGVLWNTDCDRLGLMAAYSYGPNVNYNGPNVLMGNMVSQFDKSGLHVMLSRNKFTFSAKLCINEHYNMISYDIAKLIDPNLRDFYSMHIYLDFTIPVKDNESTYVLGEWFNVCHYDEPLCILGRPFWSRNVVSLNLEDSSCPSILTYRGCTILAAWANDIWPVQSDNSSESGMDSSDNLPDVDIVPYINSIERRDDSHELSVDNSVQDPSGPCLCSQIAANESSFLLKEII